jgi:hypothetical protein
MASLKILNVIYVLRESDRSDCFFRPIVETKHLVWHFEISEFDRKKAGDSRQPGERNVRGVAG